VKTLLIIPAVILLHSIELNNNSSLIVNRSKTVNIKYAQTLKAPEFPGGDKAFQKYLDKNLKPQDTTKDIQGSVIISFFVEKDGRLSDIKVAKSLSVDLDKEALRVIHLSPNWIPATQNGKPIKSKYSASIKFYTSQ